MKFSVEREKLQRALTHVSSIIGSRSMLPLLGNVLINAQDGVLTLTTTDLSSGHSVDQGHQFARRKSGASSIFDIRLDAGGHSHLKVCRSQRQHSVLGIDKHVSQQRKH